MEKQQANVRFINPRLRAVIRRRGKRRAHAFYRRTNCARQRRKPGGPRRFSRAGQTGPSRTSRRGLKKAGLFQRRGQTQLLPDRRFGFAGLRDTRNSYINTENPPASTLVVVKQLVREEYLVEIEAVAVVGE